MGKLLDLITGFCLTARAAESQPCLSAGSSNQLPPNPCRATFARLTMSHMAMASCLLINCATCRISSRSTPCPPSVAVSFVLNHSENLLGLARRFSIFFGLLELGRALGVVRLRNNGVAAACLSKKRQQVSFAMPRLKSFSSLHRCVCPKTVRPQHPIAAGP